MKRASNFKDWVYISMEDSLFPILYFFLSTIFATFDLLHNSMYYFDDLYIKLYASKNYKNLILWKYAIR